MKRILLIFLLFFAMLATKGQQPQDYAVQLSAVVEADPPKIILNWIPDDEAKYYEVYRKRKGDKDWGNIITRLLGQTTEWQDKNIVKGWVYEYKLVKKAQGYDGYGYIASGMEIPEVEYRGKLILLVEKTHAATLAKELERYKADLEGDGWQVIRHEVSWGMKPLEVKRLIKKDYEADPYYVRAVFLLGHVPVPYSGKIMPDGHTEHLGAWPADGYYGDMDGVWTDHTINTTKPADDRNDNIPGDGKFDQNTFPSDIELMVGRVDFANMPAFDKSETELLREYLNRNHAFRQKQLVAKEQGLIDDNFGAFDGEAFAASAWRNFGPLVGCGNTDDRDYFRGLKRESYLWSYGCGAGYHSYCKGVGNTYEFARHELQSIFTILYGSYFGDWDAEDNLLRASLASGNTLAAIWSGRPHWVLHPMAMGEPLGYCARLSQNNDGFYEYNYGARLVSINLLGDPTLRMSSVTPPTSLATTRLGDNVLLNWNASKVEKLTGYNIYRRDDPDQPFFRLNLEPVTKNAFVDSCVEAGTYTYMVRSLALETSPSGSYYNLSQGLMEGVTITDGALAEAKFNYHQKGDSIFLFNESKNATDYYWQLGDGNFSLLKNPVHVYTGNKQYAISLIAYNDCSEDSFCLRILPQPEALRAGVDGYHTYLSWDTPENGRVKGYHIYRAGRAGGAFIKLNKELCTNTTFTDSCRSAGEYYYRVSAIYELPEQEELVLNESQAAQVRININNQPEVEAAFTFNQQGNIINLTNLSINAWEYEWDFGDGVSSTGKDPEYQYKKPGQYSILLTASNVCESRVFSAPVQLWETDF